MRAKAGPQGRQGLIPRAFKSVLKKLCPVSQRGIALMTSTIFSGYYFFFFFATFFLAAFFLVAIVWITPFPLARFGMVVTDHATASIFLIAKLSIQNIVANCDLAHQAGCRPSTSFERKGSSLSTSKKIKPAPYDRSRPHPAPSSAIVPRCSTQPRRGQR
jgi:uncharacterized protein (DUF58 family)